MECDGGLFESCEGEPFEFFTESTPKARKEYVCEECRDKIKAGEKYYRSRFKVDGDFTTYISCLYCHDMMGIIMKKTGLVVVMGELACAYVEYLNEYEDSP